MKKCTVFPKHYLFFLIYIEKNIGERVYNWKSECWDMSERSTYLDETKTFNVDLLNGNFVFNVTGLADKKVSSTLLFVWLKYRSKVRLHSIEHFGNFILWYIAERDPKL